MFYTLFRPPHAQEGCLSRCPGVRTVVRVLYSYRNRRQATAMRLRLKDDVSEGEDVSCGALPNWLVELVLVLGLFMRVLSLKFVYADLTTSGLVTCNVISSRA